MGNFALALSWALNDKSGDMNATQIKINLGAHRLRVGIAPVRINSTSLPCLCCYATGRNLDMPLKHCRACEGRGVIFIDSATPDWLSFNI